MQPMLDLDAPVRVIVETAEETVTYVITQSEGTAYISDPAQTSVQYLDLHYADLLGVAIPDYESSE